LISPTTTAENREEWEEIMALGFFDRSSALGAVDGARTSIVERRRRRRLGARKQRRYLNSLILMNDALAGDFSQSEIECEEEEFPDFNDWKGYFTSSDSAFRKGEVSLQPGTSDTKSSPRFSEANFIESLKKRLSKNTRRLITRSCGDSKFFRELEDVIVAFKKCEASLLKPTTFGIPKIREGDADTIIFNGFDGFQRFLLHRIAKFHDVQSKSVVGEKGKLVELKRPGSVKEHHSYRILWVLGVDK